MSAAPHNEIGIAPPAWRLPAATRLGHVTLQVASLARSLEYYERVIGLRSLERTEATAVLGTIDATTALVELVERPGSRPLADRGRLGLYHYAILLPDRGALGRFVAHLGAMGVAFGASNHLVSEALYLRDPDGLGIEVYADRPRSEWQAAGRQLRMASDPLDLDDLVRVAGEEPWAGIPSGTSMGHLHLHVGNLEAASAFYHLALGLDKMVWSYPGALFLGAGGYHHHLGLNTWAGAHAPAAAEDDARLLEWRIILPTSIDATEGARSLRAARYEVMQDGESFLANDPWGTCVRLV